MIRRQLYLRALRTRMQLYHCYWSMSHTISHLIGHFACVYVALLNKAVSDHYYIILKNIYSILVNQTLI